MQEGASTWGFGRASNKDNGAPATIYSLDTKRWWRKRVFIWNSPSFITLGRRAVAVYPCVERFLRDRSDEMAIDGVWTTGAKRCGLRRKAGDTALHERPPP